MFYMVINYRLQHRRGAYCHQKKCNIYGDLCVFLSYLKSYYAEPFTNLFATLS